MSNFPNMPILPSNSMNSIIVKRLRKEMTNMRFSTPAFVTAGPRDGDLFNWHVVLLGPPDSPYHGGVFSLRASFPPDYPYAPPKVTFNTKIYHPNIKENGEICLDILQTKGKRTSSKNRYIVIFLILCKICCFGLDITKTDSV